jgi:hypothetical protein
MTVTTSATVELRFQRGNASAEEISAEIARILADFDNPDGELAESARAAGLAAAGLSAMTIEVREGGQGFEPILTSIIVGITVNAGSTAVEEFWTKVLWPRLRRRLGPRAVLDRMDGNQATGDREAGRQESGTEDRGDDR